MCENKIRILLIMILHISGIKPNQLSDNFGVENTKRPRTTISPIDKLSMFFSLYTTNRSRMLLIVVVDLIYLV